MTYDKIILGAGLYGLYAAQKCGAAGQRVLVLERDPAPFMRATYINQAANTTQTLYAVVATGVTSVWAAGGNGEFVRYNGSSWSRNAFASRTCTSSTPIARPRTNSVRTIRRPTTEARIGASRENGTSPFSIASASSFGWG